MGVHYFNTNDNDITVGLLSIHFSKVNMSEGSDLIYQHNNELLDTPQPDKS